MFSTADVARCRSAAYAVLALAFNTPETETERQASVGGATLLPDLLEACGDKTLRRLARRLTHTWPSADIHRQLFEAAPYETGHASPVDTPGHESAVLAPFLSVIENETSRDKRGNHVAVECEMMPGPARGRSAGPRQPRRDDGRACARGGERPPTLSPERLRAGFRRRIGRADPDGFYGGMDRVLSAFVRWDCTRHGIELPASPTVQHAEVTEIL